MAYTVEVPAYGSASSGAFETGGTLTIDLGALAENYRLLNSRVLPAECAAVVKADGYGCGIVPVAEALLRTGCKTFFVAQVSEARRLRAVAPEAVIYVLNGFSVAAAAAFTEIHARPVINSLVELAEWDHFLSTSGWDGKAALHVDTGMNRLGLSVDEAAGISSRVLSGNSGITLLMSHLACAEEPSNPLNARQIQAFREIRSLYRGISTSLANSSGIFLDSATFADVVRPGIALYGGNPTPGKPNPMRPVIELAVRIIQVRNVARGESVGYGATWTAKRDSRIAVLAAGYADGIARAQEHTSEKHPRYAVVAGKRCRLVGRISMDLMTVDVTDLPVSAVQRDQMVTLIGEGLSLDEAAEQSGTISYELLTSLSRRHHRVWKS